MVKASWGGGGRGMRVIERPDGLLDLVSAARREALAAFGRDEVYFEKLVRHARSGVPKLSNGRSDVGDQQ